MAGHRQQMTAECPGKQEWAGQPGQATQAGLVSSTLHLTNLLTLCRIKSQVSGPQPSHGPQPHRQHNRLLIMKTHSFLIASYQFFIVHSFLVKMSIVGLSEWAEY